MPSEHGQGRVRLLARITAGGGDLDTARLAEVCAEVAGATGAGVMLMGAEFPLGSLCTTDDVSARIEDLQFALGEGPCIDAHREGRPVLEPDLAAPNEPRWPVFSPAAVTAGARAVFGFPLRIGTVRVGALNLSRSQPGGLSDAQHADALVLADIVTEVVLLLQADAPGGQLAAALEENADLQDVVHQASGMVAVQLGVSVGQALIRLRAHAFGAGRPLRDVADDVVRRGLSFAPDDGGPRP